MSNYITEMKGFCADFCDDIETKRPRWGKVYEKMEDEAPGIFMDLITNDDPPKRKKKKEEGSFGKYALGAGALGAGALAVANRKKLVSAFRGKGIEGEKNERR